ncbi:LacI family DNA-binding transcriptional regulator [Allopontixanthobacter sediminis]|uniref:LacI family DNA-binding transcriptional regulator n=1 Tax=Allopontixanthobacter sediminis TaxID=1689985 RepID=A0A845B385_9SPHN|nr:LacI family DNA-binding transcriptional regulator [Allopontixanthobacter sediminis]
MTTNTPTINDVARLANVSKKTVSRVINKSPLLSEKTRTVVEQVIADLGYVPNPQARALALRHNFVIAVIHDNPNAQFLVKVQQGILEGIDGTEFGMMVQPVDRNSPTVVDSIRRFLELHRPYGVVLLPPISANEELIELCRRFGCRYVRMASVELDEPQHMVTSNDREAVCDAVGYLVEMGHRRIGLIEGPPGFLSAAERRLGYEQAMKAADIAVDPELIRPGAYTFESGVTAALSLLNGDKRPTAIFASNDEMAVGVMIAARQVGVEVPDGLSIVGFDDTPMSNHVWPALTTVRWPIVGMARAAARKLIARPGDAPVEETLLPSSLMKRGSVARLSPSD